MEFPVVFAILLLAAATAVGTAEGRAPVLHRVGGDKYGWKLGVNYTDWASQERFYVGDWLYFGFDKHTLNVLEVNKTSYQNCIESNFITNITRGGRDVFNLTVARPYYFISGRGYCSRGVKLAITVVDAPPDNSPPNNNNTNTNNNNNNNNSLLKTSPASSDAPTTTTSTSSRPFWTMAVALGWTIVFT